MNEFFYNNTGDSETVYKDMPILSIGETGDDVIILQDKLKMLGYLPTPVTGGFETSTEGSVKEFQKDNNIQSTGIVDEKTWEPLFKQTESTFPVTPISLTRPTLKLGSTESYVVELQKELAQLLFFTGAIDGVFGPTTEKAVKAFQTINNLTADGIVGRATWAALAYLYSPLAICGAEESGRVVHVVQSGDTLFSIARRYGTTVEEIMRLNNLTNTSLRLGQELVIFEDTTEVPVLPGTSVHIVQSGETLFSIARMFNTTVDEIKRLNNLTSNLISIGQQLIVPTIEVPEGKFEYVVIAGDTLFSIARKYNTTVEEIIRINNLTNTNLSLGQILFIPRPAGQQFVTHTVRVGDTLYSLARLYNTTATAIRNANSLTSDIINVGRRLVIPINIV